MAKMTNCKACNAEIASSAKICPNCGAKVKKPFYKKVWFWLIIAVVVIVALVSLGGGKESGISGNQSGTEKQEIAYQAIDIDVLEEALKNNAASAKDTYDDQYVAITGRLGTIDSDLKYISILSLTDEWDLTGVHCDLKDQKAKDVVKTLTKDQIIIVKGKITDVGEVFGYYLDIDEIIPQ